MTLLCIARLVIALLPFRAWRGSLGGPGTASTEARAEAQRLARHIERAALRLPFETSCLARAAALSWMLRRASIGHEVALAVRPRNLRGEADALHAWVEAGGERFIGDLPGPWIETLRLGG